MSLLNDPMTVFAFLAMTVAFVFWLSELPRFKKTFELIPPVIYIYFFPMLATTVGITPASSPAYDWMTRYLLLFALLLLMISIDLRSVAKLGPVALFMVVAGTFGIVIGGPISLMIFKGFLPADAWTGFAALSGSWIGGTANMVAIAESVGTPESAFGPIIVVDTVVGYGWDGGSPYLRQLSDPLRQEDQREYCGDRRGPTPDCPRSTGNAIPPLCAMRPS